MISAGVSQLFQGFSTASRTASVPACSRLALASFKDMSQEYTQEIASLKRSNDELSAELLELIQVGLKRLKREAFRISFTI